MRVIEEKRKTEIQLQIEQLAKDILKLSRNTLLVNMRFLDATLAQYVFYPNEVINFGTDGKHILYNPRHILMKYKTEKEMCVRDYLHIALHCIFRHMYCSASLDRYLWNIACDIAVEASICELDLKSANVKKESVQKEEIAKLKKKINILTAEKIYAYLQSNAISQKKLTELEKLFHSDDHEIWYWTIEEINMLIAPLASNIGDDSIGSNSNGYKESLERQSSKSVQQWTSEMADEQSNNWKKISSQVQMDLQTFSKARGDTAGNMIQNLNSVNREKYDYTAFLKKFAVLGEVMKINDDEFDYIFYTYGLQLYEKMPLIEPLEYKEAKRIREFVIAIDTSGSVIGEQVQAFIQKTYNILKSTESFFSKINLHIIQCDADIQEHIKITSQEEFDVYLKNMNIKGLGGTDFRPVIETVDSMIKEHEFKNLRGLIYFTDGYGVFPAKKPDYETAFVFVKDDYEIPEVPAWAIKLVLQSDEI